MKSDYTIKMLNTFEHDRNTLRKNANYIFTKKWKNLDFTYEDYLKNPNYMVPTLTCFSLLSASVATKVGVHFGLYTKTLLSLGTNKHLEFTKRAFNLEDYGCFMLTEMGHGSNVQGILTTATYDPLNECFEINTAIDSGMKFWIGNLAQTATMGVLFANLIINGKNQGVHGFLAKLRDDDGNVLPGLTIGDCGTKMGANGVDNGWVIFKSFKVPRDGLLDKFSQVTKEGKFKSKIKSVSKRFAVQIGALSGGRIGVASAASVLGLIGTGIAVRYTTVRKQFGEKKGMENVLMDYPLVHTKLVSYISNSLVFGQVADLLDYEWNGVDPFDLSSIRVKELHALSSYIKVGSSWNLRSALGKSRELCGGHGYSAYANLATLINDTDVHVTWEGTNEVLLQQTCKNLLTEFKNFKTKGEINYVTLQFFKKFEEGKVNIEESVENIKEFSEELLTEELASLIKPPSSSGRKMSPAELQTVSERLSGLAEHLRVLLECRLYHIIDKVLGKFSLFFTQVKETKESVFRSFNKTLPDVLFPAACFFGELFCFNAYFNHIKGIGSKDLSPTLFNCLPHFKYLEEEKYLSEKVFFLKVLVLFACNTLKESATFLNGADESIDYELYDAMHDIILKVCESMRYDVLSIGDMLESPIMNESSLGAFDGDIYNNIKSHIWRRSENFGAYADWDIIRKFREENSRK